MSAALLKIVAGTATVVDPVADQVQVGAVVVAGGAQLAGDAGALSVRTADGSQLATARAADAAYDTDLVNLRTMNAALSPSTPSDTPWVADSTPWNAENSPWG